MASTSRVGTGLLGTFGLALAGLMVYTLAYQGCSGPASRGTDQPAVSDVAVFFPDRLDWSHFRGAVEACARRSLCRKVAESEDAVVVETPRHGRRVRFGWNRSRGIRETREDVERITRSGPGPVAVVGSSTSVLTVALAESLRDRGPDGPALLIPWASAIHAGGPTPLLEIDRGRTFRFCPNNRSLAASVVDCLLQQGAGRPPGRVFLVVDPNDPYSVDLSDCFRRAIREKTPAAEIVERPDAVGLPGVARAVGTVLTPSVSEAALADAIWTSAETTAGGRSTWVVLPLQGDPARRMLSALQSRTSWQTPGKGDGPVHVISGDAIGRVTLEALDARRAFPIWCASTSSACPPDLGVNDDTHIPAEIVSALLLVVDRSPGPVPNPVDVRNALAGLDLDAGDPSAFGRPLRFAADGERREGPGFVLAAIPGSPGVTEFGLGKDGRWVRVEPSRLDRAEVRP